MSALAVVGLQWGDEGKGKIVDRLAADAQHVARFQGGHNAGHTVFFNGSKVVLHLLPSGVLHANAKNYIGGGVVVSPAALMDEIAQTQPHSGSLRGRLFVADDAALVLPYHTRLDEARDAKSGIGTTRRGIGPAHEDKAGRRALRVYDLYNNDGRQKLANNTEFYNALLARHNKPPMQAEALWRQMQEQAQALAPFVCDNIGATLARSAANGERVLLEGAQAALLDIQQGTYPFVTSASCVAAAAATGIGADLRAPVAGVIKAYCTRVGNGPFPTELQCANGKALAQRGAEFGATTGRARRCGWLDIPMLRHALRINGCRRLVVTKLDVLDSLPKICLATAYKQGGKTRDLPPADASALAQCEPQYETLPGWQSATAGATQEERLPPQAQTYLRRIEELTGASIDMISTGAGRDEVIERKPLF